MDENLFSFYHVARVRDFEYQCPIFLSSHRLKYDVVIQLFGLHKN